MHPLLSQPHCRSLPSSLLLLSRAFTVTQPLGRGPRAVDVHSLRCACSALPTASVGREEDLGLIYFTCRRLAMPTPGQQDALPCQPLPAPVRTCHRETLSTLPDEAVEDVELFETAARWAGRQGRGAGLRSD